MNPYDYVDADDICWQLVSFFSLEPRDQVSLIMKTPELFAEEDEHINPGANYLLGVVYSFSICRNCLYDSAELSDESALFELAALLDLMILDTYARFWSRQSLLDHPIWRLVRRLAKEVLNEAGLPLNVPHKGFVFPEIIEIEGYPFRKLPSTEGD